GAGAHPAQDREGVPLRRSDLRRAARKAALLPGPRHEDRRRLRGRHSARRHRQAPDDAVEGPDRLPGDLRVRWTAAAALWLAAAAGRLPDIASVDSFWMPLFMAGGHVQPLNDYWPAEDRADFLPFTIQTLSDNAGRVYGVWHGTDCRVLYYRKDLVPSPPRTW